MTPRLVITAALLGTLAALPVRADTLIAQVTPDGLAELGFTFGGTARDDGLIAVRITRDPAKGEGNYRTATLEIQGERAIVARCGIEGKREGKQIIYRFEIAPESFRRSRFMVWEGPTGPKVLGGGAVFEFRLADFQDSVSRR